MTLLLASELVEQFDWRVVGVFWLCPWELPCVTAFDHLELLRNDLEESLQ